MNRWRYDGNDSQKPEGPFAQVTGNMFGLRDKLLGGGLELLRAFPHTYFKLFTNCRNTIQEACCMW